MFNVIYTVIVRTETLTKTEDEKNNKHQHNTDEGGQAMGEYINITQMMVGKQWVKNWGM